MQRPQGLSTIDHSNSQPGRIRSGNEGTPTPRDAPNMDALGPKSHLLQHHSATRSRKRTSNAAVTDGAAEDEGARAVRTLPLLHQTCVASLRLGWVVHVAHVYRNHSSRSANERPHHLVLPSPSITTCSSAQVRDFSDANMDR